MSAAYYCQTKRRKRLFRRIKIIAFAAVFLFLVLSVNALRNASAVLISVSEAAARSYTTIAVADAVGKTLAEPPEYSSFMTVSRDGNGEIIDIIVNASAINMLARQTAFITQSRLNELTSQGVDIPVGAFTGIDALSGSGFKINLKVIPVSTVECRFASKFTSAGINQTLHSLYIEIITDITVVMPSKTVNVGSADEVLVCESVIAGEIPEFILGSGWLNSDGALVPQTGG